MTSINKDSGTDFCFRCSHLYNSSININIIITLYLKAKTLTVLTPGVCANTQGPRKSENVVLGLGVCVKWLGHPFGFDLGTFRLVNGTGYLRIFRIAVVFSQ